MEKGLTQEKLAEKTELSLTVIQKVETGQSGSRLETLIRIALALGVSLDILMDMKERDEQYRDWQKAAYLLVKDKTVGEILMTFTPLYPTQFGIRQTGFDKLHSLPTKFILLSVAQSH